LDATEIQGNRWGGAGSQIGVAGRSPGLLRAAGRCDTLGRPLPARGRHDALDRAVFAAYGWDPAMSDDALLAVLLELNLKRPRA
jgi:hypothetical protein